MKGLLAIIANLGLSGCAATCEHRDYMVHSYMSTLNRFNDHSLTVETKCDKCGRLLACTRVSQECDETPPCNTCDETPPCNTCDETPPCNRGHILSHIEHRHKD